MMTFPTPFPKPKRIQTNGIELEVFEADSGKSDSGKPVVLCHGWPEHAYSWRHQIQLLVDAGYHVIVPNQRGYGHSDAPTEVTDYDINHLCDDLTGLLDHYGYDDALFIGHDWGAIIVWNMAILRPDRVSGVINLSVPFMHRGETEWISFWEQQLGPDFYMVHFNRQPGVADAVFNDNCRQFLRNMFQTNQWQYPRADLGPGMNMINIAQRDTMPGDPFMSEAELEVFAEAFDRNTFTPGINWYRNFTRNWHIAGEVEQRVRVPTLVILGDYDMVPKSDRLGDYVEQLEVISLDCGHWIQQERPAETNAAILDWLGRHYPNTG